MVERTKSGSEIADWVPVEARRYLAHTVAGQSIRTLARAAGVHASTVLRQIRRIETRRDDPLVDLALSALALTLHPAGPGRERGAKKENDDLSHPAAQFAQLGDTLSFQRESCRVLRRLCESGAVLAVAEKMEKAVVVRSSDADGAGARTAVVARDIAQAMALQDWISCCAPGAATRRINRYRVTASGRAALGRMMAQAENLAAQQPGGLAEAQSDFIGARGIDPATSGRPRRWRYGAAESPLCALARRKDRDGRPFLEADLVQAGERLREDFELAQMGPRVTQNWDRFLTSGVGGGSGDFGGPQSSNQARERMAGALADLGQGLGDVALRCCCYLEGLEVAEKRMGWSARSGKIVLRIALQRLCQHYASLAGPDRMIG